MKISISIPEENTLTNHGYGVASYGIVTSLQRLGHTVPYRDRTAPVELNFCQPNLWRWSSPNSYKIGMVAWESTKIPEIWKPGLETCDELWTPSPVVAKWFEAEGYKVTTVYEHGVDSTVWSPKPRRRSEGPIRFLHFGEPAPRKGGQITYDVFKELFGDTDVASLTIKAHGSSTIRGRGNAHPWKETGNVKLIKEELQEWELVDLIKRHDVLVYPSYGEGFGLIPLQAMSTGMPVICTDGWPPYRRALIPELVVKTRLDRTPWPYHTGDMFHPDKTDLADSMTYAVENFDKIARQAMALTPFVHKQYDWDRLTARAFAHIAERFDS